MTDFFGPDCCYQSWCPSGDWNVVRSIVSIPPDPLVPGVVYLISASPTGEFASHANQYARFSFEAFRWEYCSPRTGQRVTPEDATNCSILQYSANGWTQLCTSGPFNPVTIIVNGVELPLATSGETRIIQVLQSGLPIGSVNAIAGIVTIPPCGDVIVTVNGVPFDPITCGDPFSLAVLYDGSSVGVVDILLNTVTIPLAFAQLRNTVPTNIGAPVQMTPGSTINITAPDASIRTNDGALTVVTLAPSGANTVLPLSTIVYEKADGSGVLFHTGQDTTLIGGELAPGHVVNRFIVTQSDGVTIYGSADMLAPIVVVPLQPVKNSALTTVSSHEIGVDGTVADSVITKPDGTTTNLPATVALDVRSYRSGIAYQRGRGLWSGQTTVYTAGDEGTLVAAGWFDDAPPIYPTHYANISSWLVLTVNNIHGNTNRFTAPDGTQTYTDRIIQDHLTGYEWYVPSPPSTGAFTAAIAAALALNYGGNTDWKIPPLNVLQTIVDTRPAVILNYAPFNVSPQTIWSSTTNPATTAAAIPVLANATSQSTAKVTGTVGYFYVRKFA
jgi:hypothetical protein